MYLNNITAAKFKLCNIKKFSLQSIYKHAEKRMNTYNSLWMLRPLRCGFPNRWPALLQAWRLLHALFSYTEKSTVWTKRSGVILCITLGKLSIAKFNMIQSYLDFNRKSSDRSISLRKIHVSENHLPKRWIS